MSSHRILAALVAMTLALAASVGPSSAATEPADAVSAITLIEQRVIEIPGSQLVSLSPDGGSIAVTRPAGADVAQLCIHDVATLAERVCADVSGLDAGLWPDSVVWSPDSEWLAFAELWPLYVVDGDLWLMDASTGALANLLDDGYRGALLSTSGDEVVWEDVITLPMYPTFTPDSSAVTFSRNVVRAGEIESADIATVPITGGDAVRLGDVEREAPGVDFRRMQWSADGSRLYVSLVDQQASGLGSDSGIWVFEGDGEHARQLVGPTGPDDWLPRIVAVSPGGENLLVQDLRYRSGVFPHALVDGVSGAVERIESLRPKAPRSKPIIGAILSPDGSQLLTLSGRRARQVAVRDVAGSGETILMNEPAGDAPPDLSGRVSTWAQNDTILILGRGLDRGTLLVLDRGDGSGT
jgi:Tol biopolymer transport system component